MTTVVNVKHKPRPAETISNLTERLRVEVEGPARARGRE